MMSKNLTLCSAFILFTLCTNAQTGKENIKKQENDSTRKEQSGKADVYVLGKPIFDAEAIQKENAVPVKPIKKKPAKKKPFAKKKAKKKPFIKKV